MSEKKKFPAEARLFVLSDAVGILAAAGSLAAMAALIVSRGLSGSAAAPLATAAVGIGSFCSGWLTAFCRREGGLFCGALQGALFAGLLAVLALTSGDLSDSAILLRLGVVVLCGIFGGFLGVRGPHRRRIG